MRLNGRRRLQPSAATRDIRRRSALQTLALFLLPLGIASVCFGLYSLIQAFDAFDIAMAFKVWFSRSLVAFVTGGIALHFGGKCIEAL